jgi:hypothetical protein
MGAAVEYSRAVRPFPLRRLTGRVAAIHRRCGYLAEVTAELVASEPHGPQQWRYWLGEMQDCLEDLIEEAHDVKAECVKSYDSAPADYERAVSAMLTILRGMDEPPDGEREGAPVELAA